jgi:hypothetical protein
MCRKLHGVGYATYGMAASSGFRFVHGEELVSRFESSPGGFRAFCLRCGSKVPVAAGERVFVPVGNVEGDPGGRPEMHILVGSKAPWHPITDDLPQYDVFPPGWPEPKVERPAPSPRRHEGSVRGSCLCGGAAFEVSGTPQGIVMCHCSRCRKANSAAAGANLLYLAAELDWVRGGELRRSFRLPNAESFSTTFCRNCGSPLPEDPRPGELVSVPAGCLDDDPGVGEKLHIYVGSKAPWVEISDGLPQLQESVPRG